MPLLYMQTEQVRALQQQLLSLHTETESRTVAMLQTMNELDNSWQAPACDHFMGEIRPLLNTLARLSDQGLDLAMRMRRELDEWETTAGIFSGNELPPPSVVPPSDGGMVDWLKNIGWPPSLTQRVSDMLNTASGRNLMQEAINKKIAFSFEDRTPIGSPDPDRTVKIRFAEEKDDLGLLKGGLAGEEIVLSERGLHSDEEFAAILAHEMQHIIDHNEPGIGIDDLDIMLLQNNVDNPTNLTDQIKTSIEKQAMVEIRGFARENSMKHNKSFEESLQWTQENEYGKIVNRYQGEWENYLVQDVGLGKKYNIDLYLDENGEVQVNLTLK